MSEELRLEDLAGVGPVTTKKLNDAGIHNMMDLIVRGPVEIAELTGMDADTASKIVEAAPSCDLITNRFPEIDILRLLEPLYVPAFTIMVSPLVAVLVALLSVLKAAALEPLFESEPLAPST